MSKKLVIVESPAKAKTIGKILGNDYVIKASMGHVRDLPERSFGVDIEHDFMPQYEENKGRSKNLSDLKSSAKSVQEIYLASDPDREGEAIAWHLQELLSKINKKAEFHRVSFHEITRSAIEKAFQTPSDVNMDLVDSQQARRVLDRIVGYQTSPLLWSRIERGVSAGRVQSVALRLVCERERAIRSFVPQEYWNFMARFESEKSAGKKRCFTAKLAKIDGTNFTVDNQVDADRILSAVRSSKGWIVESIETQPRKKYAYPPFITSTLQQAASSHLGFSASQTMKIAQQLYEGVDVGGAPLGLITYMRTDSVAVAVEAQNACRSFIAGAYGPDYVPSKPNFYRTKSSAQAAHEAIRPTDVNMTPDQLKGSLDSKQLRLYTIIWQRFVASQMAPAQQMRTTVNLESTASDSKRYTFRSTATVTRFPGYLRAYSMVEEGTPSEEDEDTRDAEILSELAERDRCMLSQTDAEQKFTEPAPRFSEATLIKELESNGIGRPSTYASIVNTIQIRNYVEKEKGKLIPTELGFKINDYLVEVLPELMQVGFTADMEKRLDSVEEGQIQWTAMMHDFYDKFSEWLQTAKSAGSPESDKSKSLLAMLKTIQKWETPEKVVGKRVFDDRKFYDSVVAKSGGVGKVSARQWQALLSIALKYQSQLPDLGKIAAENGFLDDLRSAEERRNALEIQREEWRQKREEALASAPPQTNLASVFSAMESIHWKAPEKVRGRVYDDKKFFDSLHKQMESGKVLSEKQLAALGKMLDKYKEQVKGASELMHSIGVIPATDESAAGEVGADTDGEVTAILDSFSRITQWAEPVSTGRRTFNDKDFVESIASQAKRGKKLSPKQISALKKLASKYFPE